MHLWKTPDFCLPENAVCVAGPRIICASNLGADCYETKAFERDLFICTHQNVPRGMSLSLTTVKCHLCSLPPLVPPSKCLMSCPPASVTCLSATVLVLVTVKVTPSVWGANMTLIKQNIFQCMNHQVSAAQSTSSLCFLGDEQCGNCSWCKFTFWEIYIFTPTKKQGIPSFWN